MAPCIFCPSSLPQLVFESQMAVVAARQINSEWNDFQPNKFCGCRNRPPVMQPFPHPSVQPTPYSASIADLSFARPESAPSSHEHPHGSQHTPKGPYQPLETPVCTGPQGLEHFQFLPGQPPHDGRPTAKGHPQGNPAVVSHKPSNPKFNSQWCQFWFHFATLRHRV